jgi:hypothetical protein
MRSWIVNRLGQLRNQSATFQSNGPVVLGVLAIACGLASFCRAETVEPVLKPEHGEQWCFARGSWRMSDGFLEQQNADRGSVAILRDPAFSDCTLDFEFNVQPVGSGVRAAAACFRATGTLTYYWLHLDTKNNNVILVRSTPSNTWNEIHVSRDEAKTWLGPYRIDTVGGAYAATVELKDGSLLVVYYEEGSGSAVRVRRFRLGEERLELLPWD